MIDREGLARQFLFAITQIERDVRVTEMTLEEHLLLIDAILSGIDRQGYVIVPKVPTEEMCEAALEVGPIGCCNLDTIDASDIYKAMLAAGDEG